MRSAKRMPSVMLHRRSKYAARSMRARSSVSRLRAAMPKWVAKQITLRMMDAVRGAIVSGRHAGPAGRQDVKQEEDAVLYAMLDCKRCTCGRWCAAWQGEGGRPRPSVHLAQRPAARVCCLPTYESMEVALKAEGMRHLVEPAQTGSKHKSNT